MKIDLISQGRENVLFLPSNMAAIMSHENALQLLSYEKNKFTQGDCHPIAGDVNKWTHIQVQRWQTYPQACDGIFCALVLNTTFSFCFIEFFSGRFQSIRVMCLYNLWKLQLSETQVRGSVLVLLDIYWKHETI